jgi:hypothetical protein
MNQTLIRRILYGNAIFSGMSGLLSIVASRPIANFIGLDASLAIFVIGIGLVGYAALIYMNASRAEISRSFVFAAFIGDSIWVLLSIILLITGWVPFSVEGNWAVGIIALIVDIFATLELIEWRKM